MPEILFIDFNEIKGPNQSMADIFYDCAICAPNRNVHDSVPNLFNELAD